MEYLHCSAALSSSAYLLVSCRTHYKSHAFAYLWMSLLALSTGRFRLIDTDGLTGGSFMRLEVACVNSDFFLIKKLIVVLMEDGA